MKTWPTGEVAGSKEQGLKRKLQLREEGSDDSEQVSI